ncbi:MAG: hypothetical protein BGO54_15800 [Sphingobacteriales bacterium 46-32]|nr:MAG: hypothetical protein BGO54_15800 [Sphingobacteriales bacterium 46-32]
MNRLCLFFIFWLPSLISVQQLHAQFPETVFYDTVSKVSGEGRVSGGIVADNHIYLTGGSFSDEWPLPSVTKLDTSGMVIWTAIDPSWTGQLSASFPIHTIKGESYFLIKDKSRLYTTVRNERLWCISDSGGGIIWDIPLPEALPVKLIDYSEEQLILLTGLSGLRYYLVNKATGKIDYSKTLINSGAYEFRFGILVDSNRNVLIGLGDTVYKYRDRELNDLSWKSALPFSFPTTVRCIRANGSEYLIGGSNYFRSIDSLNGNTQWYSEIPVGFVDGIQSGSTGIPQTILFRDSLIYVSWILEHVGGIDMRRSFAVSCINRNTGHIRYNVSYDFVGIPPDPAVPSSQEELDWPIDMAMDSTGNLYLTGSYDRSAGPSNPGNWGIMKISGINGDKLYETTITSDQLHRSNVSQGVFIGYLNGRMYASGNLSKVVEPAQTSPRLVIFDTTDLYQQRSLSLIEYTIRYASSLAGMVPFGESKMALLKMVGRSAVVELRTGYNQLKWSKFFSSPGKFVAPHLIQSIKDTAIVVSLALYDEEKNTRVIMGQPDSIVFIKLDVTGRLLLRQQFPFTEEEGLIPIQAYSDSFGKANFIYRRNEYNPILLTYLPYYVGYELGGLASRFVSLSGDPIPYQEPPIRRTILNHYDKDTMVMFRSPEGVYPSSHFCSTSPNNIQYPGFYTKRVRNFKTIFSSLKTDSLSLLVLGSDSSGQRLIAKYDFRKEMPLIWNQPGSAGKILAADQGPHFIYTMGLNDEHNAIEISKRQISTGMSEWEVTHDANPKTHIETIDYRYDPVNRLFSYAGILIDSSLTPVNEGYFYRTLDSTGQIQTYLTQPGELPRYTKIKVVQTLPNGTHFYGGQLNKYETGITGFYNSICFLGSPAAEPSLAITGNTTVSPGASSTINSIISNNGSDNEYQWQDSIPAIGWKNIAGATAASLTYAPQHNGDKLRCLLNSNIGCTGEHVARSNTLVFSINLPTATSDPAYLSGIKMFPNPVTDMLYIDSLQLSDQWQTLEILGADGHLVMGPLFIKNKQQLRIATYGWNRGLYFIILRGKKRNVYSRVIR